MSKGELTLDNNDVNAFLIAVSLISNIALGEIEFIDEFTDDEIKGFEVLCKFLFPLVQKIHEESCGSK